MEIRSELGFLISKYFQILQWFVVRNNLIWVVKSSIEQIVIKAFHILTSFMIRENILIIRASSLATIKINNWFRLKIQFSVLILTFPSSIQQNPPKSPIKLITFDLIY